MTRVNDSTQQMLMNGPASGDRSLAPTVRRSSLKTGPDEISALDRICSEMESLFVNYLLKEMRNTIPEDGLIGHTPANDIYTSMLDSELSKTLSSSGGIGLAPVLKQQLTRALETGDGSDHETSGNLVKGFARAVR